MPISIVLQQQDQEEVVDEVAEDPPRGEDPVPEVEVEVERSPVPDLSPPYQPPPPSTPARADIANPSYIAQQSPEHIHISSRELAAVMDVVCALATTQASLDHRHIHHHRESEVVTLLYLAFLSSEACLYFGWEEKLEL